MRIVFMGTPAFAIPSLDILLKNRLHVVGVITATDKRGGRNKKQLIESDIKKYALSKGLTVLQPTNLKSEAFLKELRALRADLQMVVAFRMLPKVVWDMPIYGTYNLHGSLLPKYRGAAPINWAIIRGESITGVTSFKLKQKIDTGDIFLQRKLQIRPDDTAGTLHDRMKELAAQVVLKTVKAVRQGTVVLHEQKGELATDAPKIYIENAQIDWTQKVDDVYNFIRGMAPYPAAWTHLDDKLLKLYKTKKSFQSDDMKEGTVLTDQKTYLRFKCLDGYIEVLELQMQGKRKMDIRSFLNGYKIGIQ